MIEAPKIWEQLIEPTRFGVKWRSNGSNVFYGGSPDSRMNPINYIAMSSFPRFWNSGNLEKKFSNNKLEIVDNGVYESSEGVVTGTLGLLKLIDEFNLKPVNPSKLLLVGAISDKSLMCTLELVRHKKWNTTTKLVDLSEVPLKHIALLSEYGLFKGAPPFVLQQTDVKNVGNEKFDLIFGDILNLWLFPKFTLNRYFDKATSIFDEFLISMKNKLTKRGIFYSRCVVYPEGNSNRDINPPRMASLVHTVTSQLGMLTNRISYSFIEESLDELFTQGYPATYCGLDLHPQFREHPTLEGPKAERLIRKMHTQVFGEVEEIKIKDLRSGATYLNFACRN